MENLTIIAVTQVSDERCGVLVMPEGESWAVDAGLVPRDIVGVCFMSYGFTTRFYPVRPDSKEDLEYAMMHTVAENSLIGDTLPSLASLDSDAETYIRSLDDKSVPNIMYMAIAMCGSPGKYPKMLHAWLSGREKMPAERLLGKITASTFESLVKHVSSGSAAPNLYDYSKLASIPGIENQIRGVTICWESAGYPRNVQVRLVAALASPMLDIGVKLACPAYNCGKCVNDEACPHMMVHVCALCGEEHPLHVPGIPACPAWRQIETDLAFLLRLLKCEDAESSLHIKTTYFIPNPMSFPEE